MIPKVMVLTDLELWQKWKVCKSAGNINVNYILPGLCGLCGLGLGLCGLCGLLLGLEVNLAVTGFLPMNLTTLIPLVVNLT